MYKSLFQETCHRLVNQTNQKKIWVIGSENHEKEMRQQLEQVFPNFHSDHLLLEPIGRNTAPAILWGLKLLNKKELNHTILMDNVIDVSLLYYINNNRPLDIEGLHTSSHNFIYQ